jgi:ATP-dependent Clp protease ATP-binding subunit ClpC
MFERFTEKARRVIFFARYEASQHRAKEIRTEHLLLGLLREDPAIRERINAEDIRKEIETQTERGDPVSTAIGDDMPLSRETKQALNHAGDIADSLHHARVGTEHILQALLAQPDSLAGKILKAHGIVEQLSFESAVTKLQHQVSDIAADVTELVSAARALLDGMTVPDHPLAERLRKAVAKFS